MPTLKFSLIELCCDFASFDPHFALRRIARRFKERFDRVIGTRYGASARGHGDLKCDANLMRGFRAEGEFYKAYEKTNRRIRLEGTFTGTALSRLLRRAEFADEDDFRELFRQQRVSVAAQFCEVLQDERESFERHGSPAELISLINPMLRRHEPAAVERVFQTLVRDGRVRRPLLSDHALGRLVDAGVFQRTEPGTYAITARFRLALRALSAWDGRWMGEYVGRTE
jgi:hypothetical protein